MLTAFLHSPLSHHALTGFVVAFYTDFQGWKDWGDVEFNWKTASFRWIKGTIIGLIVGTGIDVGGLSVAASVATVGAVALFSQKRRIR
jgi:hypothetical protein